jgi:hypothetical protein
MTRTRAVAGFVALAVAVGALLGALTACGGSAARVTAGRPVHRQTPGPFSWLMASAPPIDWKVARAPGGASLAYPPGWQAIVTDPATVSFALLGNDGAINGYLNATPRSGGETLANWARFRPQHNAGEGDRRVRVLAATSDASFRSGRGSCVIDSYLTSRAAYREIACLVSGPRSTAVIVAAAPSALWSQQAATLQRAVASFAA